MAPHPAATPVSKPYEHQPYPAIRYRRGADGEIERCRVETADADAALGPEWCASPADVARESTATAAKADDSKKKPATAAKDAAKDAAKAGDSQ